MKSVVPHTFLLPVLPTPLPLIIPLSCSLPVTVQCLYPAHWLLVSTQQAELTVGITMLLFIQRVCICLQIVGVHIQTEVDDRKRMDRYIKQMDTKWRVLVLCAAQAGKTWQLVQNCPV